MWNLAVASMISIRLPLPCSQLYTVQTWHRRRSYTKTSLGSSANHRAAMLSIFNNSGMTITNSIAGITVLLALTFSAASAQETHAGIASVDLFDNGSGVSAGDLNPAQIENLAVLGKVWGFVKYHHPAVTSGSVQWDFELLRILPKVLAAKDRPALNLILKQWLDSIGSIMPCNPCAHFSPDNLHLRPAIEWINDPTYLDDGLRQRLTHIHTNRPTRREQFYVSQTPLGNPDFSNESDYKSIHFPDSGFQLLALFRLWNIIEYWAPYRDVLDEDWDRVLREAIPGIAKAGSRTSFELEMISVIAKIRDTHTNLWSSLNARPPYGNCTLPVSLRFVQGYAVVDQADTTSALQVGDIIEAMDEHDVKSLVSAWTPYYPASNDAARLRDIARNLGTGACGAATVRVRRGAAPQMLSMDRIPKNTVKKRSTHDRPGATFQLLNDEVAYIKLSSIKSADIPSYLLSARTTRGIIIDIRNYPGQFVPFALGQHFVREPSTFAQLTIGEISNPGTFRWGPGATIQPKAPYYPGKVIILVDEMSQSQAEYTAMALRVSPNARESEAGLPEQMAMYPRYRCLVD